MTTNQEKKGKSPEESRAETTIVMLPSDANPKGNVFGGVILKHVDLIAGLVAKRHAGHANVVTVIGNAVILSARINYVKRSSMEIEVNIQAEDLDDNTIVHTGTAFVTSVAIDKYGRPTPVPSLILLNDDDNRRFLEGEARMKMRLNTANRV
jgi:acyl-CoA hydrolase